MSIVIDVQGFKVESNKFVVKEFAAYDGKKISHYVFKPPFRMDLLPPYLQQQAFWVTDNHHGLRWEDGFVPLHKFSEVIQQVTNAGDRVYVKGKEKADYIRKHVSNAIVTEFKEQPAMRQQEPKCFFHLKNPCACALSNVFYLHDNFLMKE